LAARQAANQLKVLGVTRLECQALVSEIRNPPNLNQQQVRRTLLLC
jgi:hypothetical protein